MTEVIRGTIREVMEEFSGILAPSAVSGDPGGHTGVTGWPLGGITMPIGGPSISLTNTTPMAHTTPLTNTNAHTIHMPPQLAPAQPSSFSLTPRNMQPIHPSPPRGPPPLPTAWNFETGVFDSPATSTLDFGLPHQYAATDSTPSAQAPSFSATATLLGSWPDRPGDWDFSLSDMDFNGGQFHQDHGTSA